MGAWRFCLWFLVLSVLFYFNHLKTFSFFHLNESHNFFYMMMWILLVKLKKVIFNLLVVLNLCFLCSSDFVSCWVYLLIMWFPEPINFRGICSSFKQCKLFKYWEEGVSSFRYRRGWSQGQFVDYWQTNFSIGQCYCCLCFLSISIILSVT